MTAPDTLRFTTIPLTQGDGAMPALGFGTLIPDRQATVQATRRLPWKRVSGISIAPSATATMTRSARRCRRCSKRGRFGGRKSSSRRSSGTTIIDRNASCPAFEASLPAAAARATSIATSSTRPFAFQPGDEQDPRDEQGKVIYDTCVTLADTWHALERLVDDGRCRSIGLSDVGLEQLREIVAIARIKPAVVQVEAHPYLPEWELLEFCRQQGIVVLAFAALGHAMEPRVTDDPVITAIARRVGRSPAQVALAWAVQRGTALLTTSKTPHHIQENFDISTLPDDAMAEMKDGITTRLRFNTVVSTGVPGFIPRAKQAG